MLCGAAALAAGAALVSLHEAREGLVRMLPSILPINTAVAALAEARGSDGPATDDGDAADETDLSDEELAAAATDPRQRAATQYLSRRYRVADEAVGRVVAAAWSAGRSSQLDPLLILAVVAIESSMNPFAESAMGAQGLMQVMTHVHADKFAPHGGDSAALDPVANIKVGAEILGEMVRRGGSVERGLKLYVGAGNHTDDGGYSARVLAELIRLNQAVTGRVADALASGLRVDASRPVPVPIAPAAPQSSARPASAAPASAARGRNDSAAGLLGRQTAG
jgi:soluble lytic murein transglycosylase-like protein